MNNNPNGTSQQSASYATFLTYCISHKLTLHTDNIIKGLNQYFSVLKILYVADPSKIPLHINQHLSLLDRLTKSTEATWKSALPCLVTEWLLDLNQYTIKKDILDTLKPNPEIDELNHIANLLKTKEAINAFCRAYLLCLIDYAYIKHPSHRPVLSNVAVNNYRFDFTHPGNLELAKQTLLNQLKLSLRVNHLKYWEGLTYTAFGIGGKAVDGFYVPHTIARLMTTIDVKNSKESYSDFTNRINSIRKESDSRGYFTQYRHSSLQKFYKEENLLLTTPQANESEQAVYSRKSCSF